MIKDEILKNLQVVLGKMGVKNPDIDLDHPANPDFGDYSTSIALKLSSQTKKGDFLENIEWFLKNLNRDNFKKNKIELPIGQLSKNTAKIIGAKNKLIWLRNITYGKIRGWRIKEGFEGHQEIDEKYFRAMPFVLFSPQHIIKDTGEKDRYLLVENLGKLLTLVVEIGIENQKNWLVTAFLTRERYLKRREKDCLEHKKIGKPAGTAVSPILAPDLRQDGGSRFSTLQDTRLFYSKLTKQSQVDILSYEEKKSPLQIAEEIVKNLSKNKNIKKVEVVKPGFINFWISNVQLINQLTKTTQDNFTFPEFHLGKNKKVMVEFAHPNTHKLFHIGHLRNISTGESMVRILEAVGNKVIRGNYQGDVGLHIAKCLYKVKSQKSKVKSLKTLKEKVEFISKAYSEGTKAYEKDEKVKQEIIKINRMIYERNPEIVSLWTETRQWSLDYFDENYKRFYSHFDRLYFESELPKRAIEITDEILKKGILEKSQGAIVFNGKKYGLDTRVFINSLGFPTYEGKELALAEKEFSDFGELDKIIHTVTPEQTSFFKVTFKVEELIDEKKYKNKQYHLIYEWVKLKQGKMSSREGNIIEANWLIDEVKKKILEKFKCDKDTSEILAVASAKYSFLKNSTQTIIAFDIDESISIEGNSAPYLIYTYVRTQSVFKKAKSYLYHDRSIDNNFKFKKEEVDVLRILYQFPEIVQEAAMQFAPNLIANYLYDLASTYNLFYQKHQILNADEKTKQFRLMLTKSVGKVIKEGLYLLGIKTVEKM